LLTANIASQSFGHIQCPAVLHSLCQLILVLALGVGLSRGPSINWTWSSWIDFHCLDQCC